MKIKQLTGTSLIFVFVFVYKIYLIFFIAKLRGTEDFLNKKVNLIFIKKIFSATNKYRD